MSVALKKNYIEVPVNILNRIAGRVIDFEEVKEGVLIRIKEVNAISNARGCLKGSSYTVEKHLESKDSEKALER